MPPRYIIPVTFRLPIRFYMASALAAKLLGFFVVTLLLWPIAKTGLILKALFVVGGLLFGGAMLAAEIFCPR